MADDRSTTTLDSPTAGQEADAFQGESTHPLAETGKEVGERAGHLVERGTEIGFKQADRGLQTAASGVENVADTIRRVSLDMQADQPQIADVASTAADQAEALARYLRETDARQIIGSVESFARRQPLIFLGGAFVLGVAASRFIKAAAGNQDDAQRSGYGTGSTGSTGYGAGSTGHWQSGSGRGFEATGPGITNGVDATSGEEL